MPSDYLRQAAVLAGFVERWVLSLFYLGFAAAKVWILGMSWHSGILPDLHSTDPVVVNQTYTYVVSEGLMIMLLGFMGGVLLLGRRAVVNPRNVAELVVPMAAAFSDSWRGVQSAHRPGSSSEPCST